MAVSLLVAGPTEFWVGTGASGALALLGITQGGVRKINEPYFEKVLTDNSGRMGADVSYGGEGLRAQGDLIMWDEVVLASLQSRIRGATLPRGTIYSGDIGTLMALEASAPRVLLYPKYVGKPVFAAAGMQPVNMPRAVLWGPEVEELSWRTKKIQITIEAIPLFDPSTLNWILYNADASGRGLGL